MQDSLRLKSWITPLSFGLTFFLLLSFIYFSGFHLTRGALVDTDCYMRLVRVEALMENHSWFDRTILRSNAPYGETSHWSRVLDLLILALAIPFRCFLSAKDSLLYSGIFISPLLLIFSVLTLAWASKPFLKRIELPHLLLLFFCQASVVIFFQAGRPDHHSLLILFFILSLGFICRILSNHASILLIVAGAFTQALAFAVSLEFITTIILSLGVMALAWITQHLSSKTGFLFSSALLLFSILFYGLEQPWNQLYAIETDRMTLPHLTALTLVSLYWLLACGLDRFQIITGKMTRLAMTLIYALGCGTLLIQLFPILLGGPYGQMDPRLDVLWLKHVLEVQSLWQSAPGGITSLFIWLSPTLIVFPTLLIGVLRKKIPSDYMTWPWLSVLFCSGAFTLLTFYQIRWVYYAQTALVVPLAAILGHALQFSSKRLNSRLFPSVRLALLLFFCLSYIPLAVLSLGSQLFPTRHEKKVASISDPSYDLTALSVWLESDLQFQKTERILAHLDYGPELLYRTQHEVVATPYHRNGSGILFLYDLMNETSDATVLAKLNERKITLILLSQNSSEKSFLNQSQKKDTFYQSLLDKRYPNYLKPIPLPEKFKGSFQLFRVLSS